MWAPFGDNAEYVATCFFYKKNNGTYLITARHNFTAYMRESDTFLSPFVDSFFIRVYREDNQVNPITFDIRPFYNNRQSQTFFSPDFIVAKIHMPSNVKVNYINEFLNRTDYGNGDLVVCWGFPQMVTENMDHKDYPIASLKGDFTDYPYEDPVYSFMFKRSDSTRYQLHITSGDPTKGFSGAPVFIRKDNKFYFGGILTGGDPWAKIITIVRPSIILDSLSNIN